MRRMTVVLLIVCIMLFSAGGAAAIHPVAISTPDAPAAIGPYSQAIKFGELLFISGQIPLIPGHESAGVTLEGITAQTIQVMENIGAILQKACMTFNDVLMTTVYLKNLDDFETFNVVYGDYFAENAHPPARATIAASNIPKGALLEVSIIAGKYTIGSQPPWSHPSQPHR